MKQYMHMNEYCKTTGFPERSMEKLVHSRLSDEFCMKTSSARNAPYLIVVPAFEKLVASGEVREVLEEC